MMLEDQELRSEIIRILKGNFTLGVGLPRIRAQLSILMPEEKILTALTQLETQNLVRPLDHNGKRWIYRNSNKHHE